MEERIEILSVELLEQQMELVQNLKRLASELGIQLGWHYLLDLAWILSRLGPVRGKKILDAGAGTGLIQWYLAEQGAQVTSVDRESRANLSLRFRARYHVRGMRPKDLTPTLRLVRKNVGGADGLRTKSLRTVRGFGGILSAAVPHQAAGEVIIYNEDLEHLELVEDMSQDAVVAVSALEHNDPQNLPGVLNELIRVLKPGGPILATLGSARDKDWLHAPSRGWCYTEATLRHAFELSPDATSNYQEYDRLFSSLKTCEPLRQELARFYFESGDNGMPWGEWDPQYQPVGVLKVKPYG